MSRFFKIAPDRYREVPDGIEPEERGVDLSSAEELPRLPGRFERWEKGRFVVDEGGREAAAEAARLRRLPLDRRQAEAVERAKAELRSELREAGILPPRAAARGGAG